VNTSIINSFKSTLQSFNTDELDLEKELFVFRILNELEKEIDEKDLSRKNLAELMGKSEAYISQVFSAKKSPSLGFLVLMAKVLDKKLDVRAVSNIEVSRNKPYFEHNETPLIRMTFANHKTTPKVYRAKNSSNSVCEDKIAYN